ncbi:MAG: type II secretion system protein GspM [Candidatus Binatia bacterium]
MTSLWMRLSRREKILVASAVSILLLVLGRFFVVSPMLERRAWVRNQLEIQPQLQERNLKYINHKNEIEDGLKQVKKQRKVLQPALLSGDTPSVSASSLQEIIQSIAARAGTQVITTKVLNPEIKGGYTRIRIQVEVSGQIDQVVNLLKGIGSAKKLLVATEMNIRSLFRPRVVRRRRVASKVRSGQLRARLVISGIARSRAAPQPSV